MTENKLRKDFDENHSVQPGKNKGQALLIIILFLICVILAWQVISLKQQMTNLSVEKEVLVEEKDSLQSEFDVLMLQYDSVKIQYGELSGKLSAQDSIIQANAIEIRKLIDSQADYRRVKRKLDYLRGITQTYVNQLDSLFTVSKELKEENIKITADLKTFKQKTTKLSEAKDSLAQTVEKGSVLFVYNINPTAVRMKGQDKEIETDKANKTDRINVCFTISKNAIVTAGKRHVYIRLAGPDNKIMVAGKGDDHSFYNSAGTQLQFSMKTQVDYQNRNLEVCSLWEQPGEYVPGMYVASVFIDGELVGETNFTLR